MRILAACAVVAQHMNAETVTGRMLWHVPTFGTDSVILFFFLSGFVISYAATRDEQNAQSYIVARAARIYSVAMIAIPVTLIADAIGLRIAPDVYHVDFFNPDTHLTDILAYLTFTNETWNNHFVVGSDEPYWSLGFEVWYYIIFGCMLFTRSYVRILLVAACMLIVGTKIALYFSVWILGWVCFYHLQRAKRGGYVLVPPTIGMMLFFLTPILYLLVRAHFHPPVFFGLYFESDHHPVATWFYYFCVSMLFAAHLIGLASMPPLQMRPLMASAKAIRWIAGSTFTLYLTHLPIMFCLAAISPWAAGTVPRLLFVAFGIPLVVLALAELGERRKRLWQSAIAAAIRVIRSTVSVHTVPQRN
jgi:peptidoglycan/LPS O-acetylase OafA/YrhL